MLSTLGDELGRIRRRSRRGPLGTAINLLALAFVSGFLPWWKGLDFFDPFFLIPYTSLSVFFAVAIANDSFAELPPASELAGRASAVVVAAWGLGLAVLALALVTVNWTAGMGRVVLPDGRVLLDAALAALTLISIIVAGVVFLRARGVSPANAETIVKVVLIVAIFSAIAGSQQLPGWLTAQMTAGGVTVFTLAASALLLPVAAGLVVRAGRILDAH